MHLLTSAILSLAVLSPALAVPGSRGPGKAAPMAFVKTLEDPLNVTSAIHTSRPAASALYSLLVLRPDIFAGQRPQIIVPRGIWQIKKTEGKWSLLGGEFSNIELAEVDWWPKTS
ncbi:hypothetical protein B0T18DRAFT_386239 [Schizothecium vesticola]|uniref:Uncharacterized protein n=1 Tax=Schizothecium vesticola TaxID=314040 RepID=A0AA40KD02_9PEZI|nr:hypothetical protein B0T18DRAFT_386239 [Schizothecium vesticola]